MKVAVKHHLQEDLFLAEQPRLSNTVNLWDIAPRWVFYTDQEQRHESVYLSSIKREFEHGGKRYGLTLKPARITRDGTEIEEYPGAREQVVEDVIRWLASQQHRLKILDDENLGVHFSLYEIRNELGKRGHGLTAAELKEAIQILRHAEVEIKRIDFAAGEKPVKSTATTSAFPQLKLREQGDEGRAWVQFNFWVARDIRFLNFFPIDFEKTMQIKDAATKWLYKVIVHSSVDDPKPKIVFRASEIQRDCGLADRSRRRDLLRKIEKSVALLKTHGILSDYEGDAEFDENDRRAKVDVLYTMTISDQVAQDIAAARQQRLQNQQTYAAVMGHPPEKFTVMSSDHAKVWSRVKARRKLEKASAAKTYPDRLLA